MTYDLKLSQRETNGNLTRTVVKDWSKVASNLKKYFSRAKSQRKFSIYFRSSFLSTLEINDLRFYGRLLDEVDIRRLNDYTINNYVEIAKYEQAFTLKKLGDEYFINNQISNAKSAYETASKLLNGTGPNKVKVESLAEINSLYTVYYNLLVKDVQYREELIAQGYSFWGQEYSTTPLLPVTEYRNLMSVFKNLTEVYTSITASLDANSNLSEAQLRESIKKITGIYESDVANAKLDQSQFDINFYKDQENGINARLDAIDRKQREIDRDVLRYNNDLKKNEASMNSALSSLVTESVTGVPFDPTKNLGSNLREIGVKIISGNNELSKSILGTQNDLINMASLSIDYYHKAQDGLKKINTIIKDVKSGLSADNLLTIGNTLNNLGLLPEVEWNSLSQSYGTIKDNYTKIKVFESQAKSMIEKANFNRNRKLTSFSDFLKWGANSDFLPEFKDYANVYTQTCENLRRTKYESLFNLGSKILDSVAKTVSPAISVMKTRINGFRSDYNKQRPIASVLEKLEKEKSNELINALATAILNPQIRPLVRDYKIQRFLLTGISNCLTIDSLPQVKQNLLQKLLTQAPNICLNFISPKAKQNIEIFTGMADDNVLELRLRQAKVLIDDDNKTLIVKLSDQELFKLSKDSIITRKESFPFFYNDLEKESYRYLTVLSNLYKDNSLHVELLRAVHVSDWYRFLDPEDIDSKIVYDNVMRTLSTNRQQSTINSIKDDGFKTFLGAQMMNEYSKNIPEALPIVERLPSLDQEEVYGTVVEPEGRDITKDLAKSGLKMAFPGYGQAFDAALTIVTGIFDSYDLIDNLKKLYEEKKTLHNEYLSKLEQLKIAGHDKQIANFEKEIAVLNKELMQKQRDEFSKMEFDFLANKQLETRNKLANQLPIYFYFAERLRYFTNRLLKASSFWYGASNNLNDIVKNDQGNLRLALDNSINLFDWINQPDITSTRQGVDSIQSYWQKQIALISDPLNAKKLQYGIGDDLLVHSFSLDRSESGFLSKWIDFKDWQKTIGRPGTKPFTFIIDIPEYFQKNVSPESQIDMSAKVIDISVLGVDESQSMINSATSNFRITHPGISFTDKGSIQILKTKSMTTSTFASIRFDNNGKIIEDENYFKTLRNRWNTVEYRPEAFEGYSLNSKWIIEIFPNNAVTKINNVYFRLAYQYLPFQKKPVDYSSIACLVNLTMSDGKKESFRINATDEKKAQISTSLKQAEDTGVIKKGEIKEIVNKNGTHDVQTHQN